MTDQGDPPPSAITDSGTDRGDGHRAGEGRGIAGMQERALALGGSVMAGPQPDGGYAVTARLPLVSSEP